MVLKLDLGIKNRINLDLIMEGVKTLYRIHNNPIYLD